MSRGRKESQDSMDSSEIFSDSDFDADDFVDQMDEKRFAKSDSRAGWRRLEEMQEDRLLRQALNDLEDWDDFDN